MARRRKMVNIPVSQGRDFIRIIGYPFNFEILNLRPIIGKVARGILLTKITPDYFPSIEEMCSQVRLSGLPRTEAGIYFDETRNSKIPQSVKKNSYLQAH